MSDTIPYQIDATSIVDLERWIEEERELLHAALVRTGAVLLRGFAISNETQFERVFESFSSDPLEYVYRSTPRTDLGRGVYTATEYPPGLTIPLHNENSYQRDWPLHLLFFCMYPADNSGGLTPLARTVSVTRRIDKRILGEFDRKGVMYVRNYTRDHDLPWQTVFQTDSKPRVEEFCASQGIVTEWIGNERLRTRQICHALASHPQSGVTVWFNQAHLFHPSALDARTRQVLREMFKEEYFPRNAFYGDGSPISEDDLHQVRDAFKQEERTFPWQRGDVLILDNMLISHGRTPYKGKRRVLVAMCDPYSGSG